MKNFKLEKVIFGIGGFLLLAAGMSALVDFDKLRLASPVVAADAPANPWTDPANVAPNGGNGAGLVTIAMQNPAPQNSPAPQGNEQFLAQQAKVNKELIKTIRLAEAHWQGMELMELSEEKKMKFQIPMELAGLMVDEVTLNSMLSGVVGGDVLQKVDGTPVYDLRQFQELTRKMQKAPRASLTVWRQGQKMEFTLNAEGGALGMAQMESAPMILPGDMRPHPYRGPCTECHLIGGTTAIGPDPDTIILPAPAIRAGSRMPHRDRGQCKACHVIVN